MKVSELNKQVEKDYPGITDLTPKGRIPSGIFALDYRLAGGIPIGRMTTIFGPEASGKSNLALKFMAGYQQEYCDHTVFIDIERTFDEEWVKLFGVDMDRVTVVQPATAEEAIDVADMYARADDIGFMVVDSLAAMISIKEVENDAAWVNVGGNANQIQLLLKKLMNAQCLQERQGNDLTVLALNQMRASVAARYGPDAKPPGGWFSRHCMSMAMQMYSKPLVNPQIDKELPVSRETHVTLKKWKCSILSQSIKFEMGVHPAVGIGFVDSANALWNQGSTFGLITGSSGSYECFGVSIEKKFEFMEMIQSDPMFRLKCQQSIIEAGQQKMLPAQSNTDSAAWDGKKL